MRRFDIRDVLAVFAGGAVGTAVRAGLVELAGTGPGQWPWATFAANVAGAFLLGWIAARLPVSPVRRLALGTGLCGGLTTFSTLQVEVVGMLDGRHFGLAAGYLAASLVAGLAAAALGGALVRVRR